MIERTELMKTHFRFVADLLEQRPELWNQEDWGRGLIEVTVGSRTIECGSAGCVAGHLGASLGLKPRRFVVDSKEFVDWTYVEIPEDLPADFPVYFGSARQASVGTLVGTMLGLNFGEWDALFSPDMMPADEDVSRMLREMADGFGLWEAMG